MRCPQCLGDTLRPELLTVGRWLQCSACGCAVIPSVALRRVCTSCGRRRCQWARYGLAEGNCTHWRAPRRPEFWRDEEMFE